jgi:hypothetical protein
MAELSVLPSAGGVLFDARNDGHALRVGWHPSENLVVLSIWRGAVCAATCRLTRDDAAVLIAELAAGLAAAPAESWTTPSYARGRSLWRRRFKPGWQLRSVTG